MRGRCSPATVSPTRGTSTADGRVFIFRDDGTCEMDGEELCFLAETWSLNTGASRDKLSLTHKITAIEGDDLTLRDVRNGGNRTIRLTRVTGESSEPAPDAGGEAIPTPAPEDFVVVDE